MSSFIPKFFIALAMLLSFSIHANLQKSLISQQLAYENVANQHIEIVDYDIVRDFEAVKNTLKEGWDMLSGRPYDEQLVHKLFAENVSANRFGVKTIIKVARVNGQTAGVMTFVPGNLWPDHYGMVELLAVGSQFRNKGIGYKLLSAAQELAQKNNAQGLELHVFTHNIPAIKLYEKFGFRQEVYDSYNVALMAKSFNSPKPYPMTALI
jgi:ribosomal protein S18 acetylase RimI-like enzyme